jgi:hypothetical protein
LKYSIALSAHPTWPKIMRITVATLACLAICTMTPGMADPPSTTQQPAAAPAQAAPTEAPKVTVVVQGSPEDILEKHFLAEGYKQEMHNGEKVFCRREDSTGSRLGAQKVCGSAQQLQQTEQQAQAAYQRGQSQQSNPKGN